jgi:tetratricopeptide (TPR) repeat protein
MFNNDEIPEGYSFSIPEFPPTGSKALTALEAEQYYLNKIKGHEQEWKRAKLNLIIFYQKVGRFEPALEILKELLEMARNNEEKAHSYLTFGQFMEQEENFAAAVEYYTQASLLEHTNTETSYFINNNLGYSLNKLGKFEEGEKYCRKAIEIDPNLHNAYKNLGISLEGQDHYEEAANNYVQATKLESLNPRAAGHLQDLLERHPEIIEKNPGLSKDLENCQKAVKFAQKSVSKMNEDWQVQNKDRMN